MTFKVDAVKEAGKKRKRDEEEEEEEEKEDERGAKEKKQVFSRHILTCVGVGYRNFSKAKLA